jgi:small-conductance mechanosensitive channel
LVVVRIAVSIVVIFAAPAEASVPSQARNRGVLALPKLIVAAALVLAGVVAGGFVGERVERASYQMDLPLPLGRLAQIAVVAVFVITAAAQIAIPTIVLMVPLGLALATVGAGFALAFGLGGRDIATALSAGRYVRTPYAPGQRISVGEVTVTVRTIEGAATVLEGSGGRTVRIPNHLLLTSVVTIHSREWDRARHSATIGRPAIDAGQSRCHVGGVARHPLVRYRPHRPRRNRPRNRPRLGRPRGRPKR